jgi:hypothetical protein
MNKHKLTILLVIGIVSTVFANAGIPMIAVMAPSFAFALVPVILIEGIIIMIMLKTHWIKSMAVSSVANAITTIIGIPLTWILLVIIDVVLVLTIPGIRTAPDKYQIFLTAPWLNPWVNKEDIILAGLILLVPFFIVSWFVEYRIAYKMLKIQKPSVKKCLLIGNLLSYSMLAILFLVWTGPKTITSLLGIK